MQVRQDPRFSAAWHLGSKRGHDTHGAYGLAVIQLTVRFLVHFFIYSVCSCSSVTQYFSSVI